LLHLLEMNLLKSSSALPVVILLTTLVVFGQHSRAPQSIALIGTKHTTPETELVQIDPVKQAVLDFKPDVICIEARKPDDSVSIRYIYGARHYKKQDSIRKAWKIPFKSDSKRINELFASLKKQNNLAQRMELRNIFYVRSDFGNSDYQAYLIMDALKADSSQAKILRKRFPMFDQMKSMYQQRTARYDEYTFLVFPVAKELGVIYLNPVDDQSTNKVYQKFYDKLQRKDTIYEDRRPYLDRVQAFFRNLNALPPETNTWVYSNSPEIIEELKYVEAYKLDAITTSRDVKMLSHYWIRRNKKMATYIDQVAKKNPGKKMVVFFGASHVGPVFDELKKINKKHHLITLYDLIN
jgi:hypothetical protein